MRREGWNIPIRNVYHMLAYAFQVLRQGEYTDVATEDFEHVHDLLAAILARGVGRQLKQGLHREYVERHDELATLRGKVDVGGTVAARLARRCVISCEYDELSEDNALNQALKATCMLLVRHGRVKEERQTALRREMLFFSGVADVDPATIRWEAFRFSRGNQSYRMLLSICQLVVEGMLLTTEDGRHRLAQFIDDQRMHRLYEKFILEYYVREHPELEARASQIQWALDDGVGTMLPIMQSDITLTSRNDPSRVLIIDAKFYSHTTQGQYDSHTVHSANLYQVFTYVKNREAGFGDEPHEVGGMLLYARTNDEVQPNQSYMMSGNRIEVRTLDLNLRFEDIAAQLDGIAEEHFNTKKALVL